MSLISKITSVLQAIGADIKSLQSSKSPIAGPGSNQAFTAGAITMAGYNIPDNINAISAGVMTAICNAGIASKEIQKTLKQRIQTGTATILQSSGSKTDVWTWSTAPYIAVTLPYNLDSTDYIVLLEVVSFTGSASRVGSVTAISQTTTGFYIQHTGTADSVVVKWVAVRLSL